MPHLLFIRSATESEIVSELKLPFQLKRFKTMRGTESQIMHVRNLLLKYGWDEFDAPDFENSENDRDKDMNMKLLEDTIPRDQKQTKNNIRKKSCCQAKSKVTLSLRLSGIDFNQFQSSETASDVTLNEIAKALKVDVNSIRIINMEAGSVILNVQIISATDDEKMLESRFDEFIRSENVEEFQDAIQKSMESVLDLDAEELEVQTIKKVKVESLEAKATIDPKKAAKLKRKAERDARRKARADKKAAQLAKKEEKKAREDAARKKAEEDEKREKESQLSSDLVPVHTWFQMLRSDGSFEDPRFQFGDPVPANSPGGIHIDIIRANNLAAMDISFSGGSSDPFVKVVVGQNGPKNKVQKFKTAVKKGTLKPVWENLDKNEYEHFDFWRESQLEKMGKSEVVLQVFDYDFASGDDFMGEVRLNVNELPYDKCGNLRPVGVSFEKDKDGARSVKLQPKPGSNAKVKGTLVFRAWRTPSSDERARTMKYITIKKQQREERAREIRLKAQKQKIERQRAIAEAEERNKQREAEARKRERRKSSCRKA